MQTLQPQTDPNLTSPLTFGYKDILVKKLVRAVSCSVTSQLIILLIYTTVANINLFQPTEWITSTLNTFTHLSTWIFVVIFSFIIFAQCLICAKDYVLMSTYCSTRFKQLLHIFSLHNFILLGLHVVIGGAFVWQILAVIDSRLKNLTTKCENRVCFVEDTFFLIVSGLWTGFYYFLKVYVSSKHLVFPVIQQKKFLQFRSHITILFKESMTLSIWPTIYFAVFYYLWGGHLGFHFRSLLSLDKSLAESSVLVYVYGWWFSTLYFFNMNLMRFFFHLYLTAHVKLPLVKENNYILTLQEALVMDKLPIIQHLACLDLFMLSQWSPQRRRLLFSLSQPGGHPHNWNSLVESVLKLFNNYIDLIKKSTEEPHTQQPVQQSEVYSPFSPLRIESPTCPGLRFRNLRNMSGCSDCPDIVNVSHNITSVTVDSLRKNVDDSMKRFVDFLKMFFGFNFLFGELPGVNIQKCLGNGQLVIWTSQGIAELAAISLHEDQYGIVQKDLPVIISTLVQLKQNLDKLNKVPALTRKVAALDDFNYKMKNAVIAAVRHSLFHICLNFGEYFHDFPLSKEVLKYLQVNIMLKNCNQVELTKL